MKVGKKGRVKKKSSKLTEKELSLPAYLKRLENTIKVTEKKKIKTIH
jgi:hypothetical protein